MREPWIQVSVDTQDVQSALKHVAHAVAIDAEWIEVGTPLLTFAGIQAIGAIADEVQDRVVVADFKALDGVGQYFQAAGELGASVATVMAVANEASIEEAINVGHRSGVKVQVDLLNVPSDHLGKTVRKLSAMGADYFLVHLAIDELKRNPGADPLLGLNEVVSNSTVPVGPVVFNAEQAIQAMKEGASYVVIGYPLITASDARAQLRDFAESVRRVRPYV